MGAVEEMVWVLQRGHSGDRCELTSIVCMYDLRKGDLFVLSWPRQGLLTCVTNWQTGPHAVSTIAKCFQNPGCY